MARTPFFSLFGSFLLAATAAFALMMHAGFIDYFHSARLGVVLVILLLIHCLRYPQLLFCREYVLYSWFIGYMIVQLLWTNDVLLAMNTLEPAINFLIIMLLFGSLITYHNTHAVLAGIFVGFVMGAAIYSLVSGFPFVRPRDFSYNAVSFMYLFGLFVTLLFSRYVRSKGVLLFASLIIMLHIIATTSIKTNLGILLGTVAASLIYFRDFVSVVRRNAVSLIVFGGMLGFVVLSNGMLLEILDLGIDRVVLGVEILRAGTDLPGYSGMEERIEWLFEALYVWVQNPIFGYGVEAFRSRYGITAHSTLIDLLYNSGFIGLALFYSVLLSIIWRLFSVHDAKSDRVHALILGATTCYLFISMAGNLHTNVFLAVFTGISVALLNQAREQASQVELATVST